MRCFKSCTSPLPSPPWTPPSSHHHLHLCCFHLCHLHLCKKKYCIKLIFMYFLFNADLSKFDSQYYWWLVRVTLVVAWWLFAPKFWEVAGTYESLICSKMNTASVVVTCEVVGTLKPLQDGKKNFELCALRGLSTPHSLCVFCYRKWTNFSVTWCDRLASWLLRLEEYSEISVGRSFISNWVNMESERI